LRLSQFSRIFSAMPDTTTTKKPRIANIDDPTILAAIQGWFRLTSQAEAMKKLAWIGKHFIRAHEQDAEASGAPSTLRLWIKGFAVTPEERANGYRGHYAHLGIAPIDGGRYAITAEKLLVELARHPQKAPPKMRHPNRGHPVMRAAETGKVFSTVTIIREKLMQFHEAFSSTTIPGKDKLHVLLYNRKLLEDGGPSPIEKVTLKIQVVASGGAKLVIIKPSEKKKQDDRREATEAKGKFTAMVKQRRPRKCPPKPKASA
jgi:hypothetical protein